MPGISTMEVPRADNVVLVKSAEKSSKRSWPPKGSGNFWPSTRGKRNSLVRSCSSRNFFLSRLALKVNFALAFGFLLQKNILYQLMCILKMPEIHDFTPKANYCKQSIINYLSLLLCHQVCINMTYSMAESC